MVVAVVRLVVAVPSHQLIVWAFAKYLFTLTVWFAPVVTTVSSMWEPRAGVQGASGFTFQLSCTSQSPGWFGEKVARLVFGYAPPLMMSAALRLIV